MGNLLIQQSPLQSASQRLHFSSSGTSPFLHSHQDYKWAPAGHSTEMLQKNKSLLFSVCFTMSYMLCVLWIYHILFYYTTYITKDTFLWFSEHQRVNNHQLNLKKRTEMYNTSSLGALTRTQTHTACVCYPLLVLSDYSSLYSSCTLLSQTQHNIKSIWSQQCRLQIRSWDIHDFFVCVFITEWVISKVLVMFC